MAAPMKTGLDYYPRRTKFFNNPNLLALQKQFGFGIYCIYEAILDKIYGEEGYYYDLNEGGREALEIYLFTCFGWANPVTDELISGMLDMLGERMFDDRLFKRGILTSVEIQETFYLATAKRRSGQVNKEIWLIDVKRMEELGKRSPILAFFKNEKINDVINSQSKPNKSKPNQNKQDQTRANTPDVSLGEPETGDGAEAVSAYEKNFGTITQHELKQLDKWRGKIEPSVTADVFRYCRDSGYGFSYGAAIINRLIAQGTVNMELYKQREQRLIGNGIPKNRFVNYDQPVYTQAEIDAAIARKKKRGAANNSG